MARPSRKIEIKERVLLAALELIVEGGFQQSPMSKLAKLAGLSVGTIYLYFPSKEEIIAALFENIRQQMQESILSGYDPKASIHSRFETLFMNIGNHFLENKRHFIFMDQFGLSSYNTSLLDAYSEKVAQVFLIFHNDGVKTGVLKPFDVQVSLSLTSGPTISLIKKHYTGFLKIDAAILEQLKTGVWAAISI